MLFNRAALLAAAAAISYASPVLASNDNQLWTSGGATVKLSEKFRLSQEATARFSDTRRGLYQIEINTLLGYRLSKKVTVWAGYTHDRNYAAGNFIITEHRAREQITFDSFARIGPAVISGRLRLEQRWREGIGGTGWRVRPNVKLTLPLRKDRKTAFVLNHESFVNLNTTAFQRVEGFDRMRNLAAINTPLAKNIALEVGYLHQRGFVRGGDDSNDHVASFALNFSF